MKILPSIVREFRSNAERKVFDQLRETDLGPYAFALHSLNLSQHDYKRWAEIDFVVAWEEGAFALEVKGGRVSCSNGIWTFTNRFGESNKKSEGPFDQAKSGHDALRQLLGSRAHAQGMQRLCWGWGVLFPDCDFDIESVSWQQELFADLRQLDGRRNLEVFLRRLAKWWRSRGQGHRSLAGSADLAALQQSLRPDFDKVPSLASSINYALDAVVRLTAEQIEVLDSIDDNPRIFCSGGAGTGKSFLAVESARRESASGRRTLLVCRSEIFSAFLRSRIGNAATVCDFSSFDSMIDQNQVFDALVVDEAQDLMTSSCVGNLAKLLNGGIDAGRWRMFLDPNNQSGLHEPPDPEVIDRLCRIAAIHKLRRNCRNTEQIVLQTQLITGADIGVAVIEGQGPPIEIVTLPDSGATAIALERRIVDWLDAGVRPGHITVLSMKRWSESAARKMSHRVTKQMETVTAAVAQRWPSSSITFSTVIDFKGLENRCVAVVDLEGCSFDGNLSEIAELYVAMTRANAGLWIAVPASVRAAFDRIVGTHAQTMLQKQGVR